MQQPAWHAAVLSHAAAAPLHPSAAPLHPPAAPLHPPATGPQTYLEQNEGPGLQHLALKTDDIFHTLR